MNQRCVPGSYTRPDAPALDLHLRDHSNHGVFRRTPSVCRRVLLGVLLLAGTTGLVTANVRAPRRVLKAPSAAAYPSPTVGLTALREELQFYCEANACDVTAVYHIRSETSGEFTFEFIAPTETAIEVQLEATPPGDEPSSGAGGAGVGGIQAAPATSLSDAEKEKLTPRLGVRPQVARANFAVRLIPGVFALSVRYLQPTSAIEKGYSYFGSGVMYQSILYHLWPLKEWSLAPDFRLDLAIRAAGGSPSAWERFRKQDTAISCRGLDDAGGVLSSDDERIVYQATLVGAKFPDVLECDVGPRRWVQTFYAITP